MAYNEEANIERAIKSALTQTISDQIEIIIVDDGSSDDTLDICKTMLKKHHRLNLIQSYTNKGYVTASMTGIAASQGKYFIRLDGDDIIYPKLAESLLNTAIRNNSEVVIGGYTKLYINNNTMKPIPEPLCIRDFIMCGNLISKKLFFKTGGLRNLYFEEYDLFLRLQEITEFSWNKKAYYEYRIHNGSCCHQSDYWEKGIKELAKLWSQKTLEKYGFTDLLTQDQE